MKDPDLVARLFESAMEVPARLLTRTGTIPSRTAEAFAGELEAVLAHRIVPLSVTVPEPSGVPCACPENGSTIELTPTCARS